MNSEVAALEADLKEYKLQVRLIAHQEADILADYAAD